MKDRGKRPGLYASILPKPGSHQLPGAWHPAQGEPPPTHPAYLEAFGPMPQAGEEQLTFGEGANPKLSFSHAILGRSGKERGWPFPSVTFQLLDGAWWCSTSLY